MDDAPFDGPGRRAQAALREKRRPLMEASRRMLVVEHGDGTTTPAPAWTQLAALLAPAGWSDDDRADWVSAANAWLEGRSPAEEIRDHPDAVTLALSEAVRHAIPSERDIG